MEVGEKKMGHRRHNEEENRRLPRRNYYSQIRIRYESLSDKHEDHHRRYFPQTKLNMCILQVSRNNRHKNK